MGRIDLLFELAREPRPLPPPPRRRARRRRRPLPPLRPPPPCPSPPPSPPPSTPPASPPPAPRPPPKAPAPPEKPKEMPKKLKKAKETQKPKEMPKKLKKAKEPQKPKEPRGTWSEQGEPDVLSTLNSLAPIRGSTSSSQEYNWSINGSQPDDDRVTDIFKDYDMYLAAKNGTLDEFERALDRVSAAENVSFEDIMCRLSPAGNTLLHVAAKHEKVEILTVIVEKKPSLVLSKNCKGETALHLGVKAGHESTVRELVQFHKDLPDLKPLRANLLRSMNDRGNTALHEALFNVRGSIAEYLIKEDPELSYYRNNDGESALYLAAKAGSVDCVSLILGLLTDQERVKELFKKKSPIQAAIQGKHRDVLEAMFTMNSSFIRLRDEEGRNPLHYAASLGNLEEVRYLLTTEGKSLDYARNPTRRDEMGAFPIHLASTEGHVDVVRLLLQDCPDPGELLDRDYRNILHVAAMNGRSDIVNFILKNPDLEELINMKDIDGNTPLHLAAMHFQPKIVSDLTWDKRVDINLANDWGMTALNVAEDSKYHTPRFIQILTWVALRAAVTPRSLSGKTVGRKKSSNWDQDTDVVESSNWDQDTDIVKRSNWDQDKDIVSKGSNWHQDKDIVNTLLLVSTLVATVTYAAGFTMPGGYNSSDSDGDVGMATMMRHKGFHIFVFCDTIALYTSIVVVVALIWTHFGDPTLVLNALTLVVPFLGIALSMMSVAFAAGVFLVVNKIRWLSAAVLVMGITFLVIMFLLLLPLWTPLASRNRILRYLSYYPFRLLVLASSKCLVV